jgi:hypothetical protein
MTWGHPTPALPASGEGAHALLDCEWIKCVSNFFCLRNERKLSGQPAKSPSACGGTKGVDSLIRPTTSSVKRCTIPRLPAFSSFFPFYSSPAFLSSCKEEALRALQILGFRAKDFLLCICIFFFPALFLNLLMRARSPEIPGRRCLPGRRRRRVRRSGPSRWRCRAGVRPPLR